MYTDADARFDSDQLHGPCCPRHGSRPCGCCRGCGCSEDKAHAAWCPDVEQSGPGGSKAGDR